MQNVGYFALSVVKFVTNKMCVATVHGFSLFYSHLACACKL